MSRYDDYKNEIVNLIKAKLDGDPEMDIGEFCTHLYEEFSDALNEAESEMYDVQEKKLEDINSDKAMLQMAEDCADVLYTLIDHGNYPNLQAIYIDEDPDNEILNGKMVLKALDTMEKSAAVIRRAEETLKNGKSNMEDAFEEAYKFFSRHFNDFINNTDYFPF